MSEHINSLCNKCGQMFYGLKILKHHGLSQKNLDTAFRALVISRLTYASPAWSGFLSTSDLNKLASMTKKGHKWNLTSDSIALTDIFNKADQKLFCNVLSNDLHTISPLLPPVRNTSYSLRNRPHNLTLPHKNSFAHKNFVGRMIYKNTY